MNDARHTPPALVRFATWNLQSCTRGIDGVVAQLRALDADVVVLQEVDRSTRRARGVDQAARIAELAGYAHHRFFAAMDWDDAGEYGLAVLSRCPITASRVEKLPTEPGTEQRVLGCATVELPGGPLSVYVTHLSHRPSEAGLRARQVAHIHAVMAADPHPGVLAGDLNDVPGSATHRAVTSRLVDAFDAAGEGDAGTFPLPLGIPAALRIDYVFASREIRPLAARVVQTRASDHHALTARLAYPASRTAGANPGADASAS